MIKFKIKSITNRQKWRKDWIIHSFWSVDDTLNLLKNIKKKKGYIIHNGVKIGIHYDKFSLFLKGKHCCKLCKLPITYVVLEKQMKDIQRYHFNFYTIHPENKQEILFNIDHIIPKSKGGQDHLDNYQLTCEICNMKKGNNMSRYKIFKIRVKNSINSMWRATKSIWALNSVFHFLNSK